MHFKPILSDLPLHTAELRRNTCYRIMTAVSFTEILQLFMHCYGGIVTMTNNSLITLRWMMVLSTVGNAGLIANIPICLVLAMNRLMIFDDNLMSKKPLRLLFRSVFTLSCLWTAGCFLFYLTPVCPLFFANSVWTYTADVFDTCVNIENICALPILLILPIYLYIIYLLRVLVNRTGPSHSNNGRLSSPELRLLVQAMVNFLLMASMLMLGIFLRVQSMYAFMFSNYWWILFNGMNPVMYITMNA